MSEQPDLFGTRYCSTCPSTFVPDSDRQELCGARLKRNGMKAAATNQARRGMLLEVKRAAVEAAWTRREVTIEDAYRVAMRRTGKTLREITDTLGPAAGSVFKGGEWSFTGSRRRAKMNRKNHARELKVWRLASWAL